MFLFSQDCMNQRLDSSISFSSYKILAGRVDALDSHEAYVFIGKLVSEGRAVQVLTVNALMLDAARNNPELARIFQRAELCLCESSGVELAFLLRGLRIPKITGIDFAEGLCAWAAENNRGVYFLGAQPGVANKAAENLKNKYPKLVISGTQDGYSDLERGADLIQQSGAKILLAALGSPKQEIWIDAHRQKLTGICAIGVGGSFDVWSGNIQRAPKTLQTLRLEWLWRFLLEPRRIKQIPALLRFLFHSCR